MISHSALSLLTRRVFLFWFVFALCWSCLGTEAVHGEEAIPVDENLIVLISDTHIHHEDGGLIVVNPELKFDPSANLKKIVQEVLAMRPRPAGVVCLGDLIHRGTADTPYEMLKEILKPWDEAGMPYYLALGNHDQPWRFFKVFPEWKEKMVPGSCAHKASFKNIDFLILETTDYTNGWYGIHPEVQRKWLVEQLAAQTKPVFVCGHHNWELMREKPEMTNPFIQGWMCGHFHDFVTNNYEGGIRELRIPSTAHSSGPNSAYVLLRVTENGYQFDLVPILENCKLPKGMNIFLEKKEK